MWLGFKLGPKRMNIHLGVTIPHLVAPSVLDLHDLACWSFLAPLTPQRPQMKILSDETPLSVQEQPTKKVGKDVAKISTNESST